MAISDVFRNDSFRLIGHANPFNQYPATVIPVGQIGDEYYAVYLSQQGEPHFKKLNNSIIQSEGGGIVRYGEDSLRLVQKYSASDHRLFAFSSTDVHEYPLSEEKAFFLKTIRERKLLIENPFIALELAELAGNSHLASVAVKTCYQVFAEVDKGMADEWLGQRAEKKNTNGTFYPPFFYGTGRRKAAVARVFLFIGVSNIIVNHVDLDRYFTRTLDRYIVRQPLSLLGEVQNFRVNACVKGGGISGQAQAVRLGLSKALVSHDTSLRSVLRKAGFLTTDARKVERKKVGRRKARKLPQYSKR